LREKKNGKDRRALIFFLVAVLFSGVSNPLSSKRPLMMFDVVLVDVSIKFGAPRPARTQPVCGV
jgi:hypothetical protein